jgi:hypothetical protein
VRSIALPLVLLLSVVVPAPAAAALPGALVVAPSLGGGGEVGRGGSEGLGELELALGWEHREVRPELAVVFGLAPGSYLGLRPGVRVALRDTPLFLRGALDWAHTGSGSWPFRWLLLGAGAEARLTSVLGGFAEVDAGVPFGGDRGVGLLVRAGFAFRFEVE